MEASKEPISVRIARINSLITGNNIKFNEKLSLLDRESLLDSLQSLYEECSLENLQKYDANIANFVAKYRESIEKIGRLRVNLTDFEIKNVIGRGHFGEVHVVKEKQTGDVYAMKTLRKFDQDLRKTSFEEERNIMAFSNSHWLTSLQYAFQDSACLYFIMEYHPGGDLLGLLYRQGGTLPESAAIFYVAELILALEDLHKMGYVHRDVKPDNVLLDRLGHLKLADFGSAARLDRNGTVSVGPPVGTPDYIAPEVLQCLENKKSGCSYGVSCDFWSLGVLAYELTIGSTPFAGTNSVSTYSKIINYKSNLKFPPDVLLSQAYVDLIRCLITDETNRADRKRLKNHPLFEDVHFDTLKDQVPPFVPKIGCAEDSSNFCEVQRKKATPGMENFKKRAQFSGRNLPFVGFTFANGSGGLESGFERRTAVKEEAIEKLKAEADGLRLRLKEVEELGAEKGALERRFEEMGAKLEGTESLRDSLEKDLANCIAECAALKRTLELERKDRSELERKALDLIKAAKTKWETAEKNKVEALNLEIEQQKAKISQLTTTNEMLNDQLQKVLKNEGKHKESLEKVEHLSRRSVIGLEARLDRVTNDSQSTISDLQKRISDEILEKNSLKNKVRQYERKEMELEQNLHKSESNFEVLKSKIEEAEAIIRKLNEQVNELEEDVGKLAGYEREIQILKENVEEGRMVVKDFENKNVALQSEVRMLENCKLEIEELRKTIAKNQNDKRVGELESRLSEEREKCAALEERLRESENVVTENQELKELRTKYWRTEKDFGNCKVDKRILERELKEAQNEIRKLNGEVESSKSYCEETKKRQEAALVELNNINESYSVELMKMRDSYNNLQEKLNNEKEKIDAEKQITKELKDIIKSKDDTLVILNFEVNNLKRELAKSRNELEKLDWERTQLGELTEKLEKEKSEARNESEKRIREIENTNLNLTALREACTLLENQVIEYEKIISNFESKQTASNENVEKLISDLCRAKSEVQEAKRATNEEKSLKLLAESKAKRLRDDVDCLQREKESYKAQCVEFKQYSTGLSEELTVAEEKLSDFEVRAKVYERQVQDLKRESKALKEEVSECLTKLSAVKESNYKLNKHLRELKEDKGLLVERVKDLEGILGEKVNYYKERETKAEGTIGQQIKLIDYLQTKIDEQSSKKRTLTSVLFGGSKKENQPPVSLAMNYKDLETQLSKERRLNKQLQEEVFRLKAAVSKQESSKALDVVRGKVERQRSEVISPRSKATLETLVSSPSQQKKNNDMARQNSLQRMHHNIPHRFDNKLCTKPSTKCANCSEQVGLGHQASVCVECNVAVHKSCAHALPNSCGIPRTFVEHYRESLVVGSGSKGEADGEADGVNVEGWIKVPSKNSGWEKRWAVLTNCSINIYKTEPKGNSQPIEESFPLKPDGSHGKVILEPVRSEIAAPVANSDLPFVIKVEVAPDTTCWPAKSLVFMTLSTGDKERWFSALQKTYDSDSSDKPQPLILFSTPDDLDINSLVDLTKSTKIIGAKKGLFAHSDNSLLHIEGPNEIHQISPVPSLSLVLMIANQKRILIMTDSNHLLNLSQCAANSCLKPKLKFDEVKINNLNGFQALEVSKRRHQICVATRKQLIILSYDLEAQTFNPVRVLDTLEPVSCALFTDTSLIVGADKFFEIDLQDFEAGEFLDGSDSRLNQALNCYKMGSFPLAILQVSSNPKEYLLGFNEFAVFVDEYGRSSRLTELKSQRLPLNFHFGRNVLYVVQFAAVEMLKVTEETCNCLESDSDGDFFRFEMDKFGFIGANSKGVYLKQGKSVLFVEGRKFLDFDLVSEVSEVSESENDSDRFSFSSSMVQSLDGCLSDADGADDGELRRVQFAQTSL